MSIVIDILFPHAPGIIRSNGIRAAARDRYADPDIRKSLPSLRLKSGANTRD